MTPTTEEAKRYGLALAALRYGLGVIWDSRGPSWRCRECFADSPTEALAAAAEALGLEPVGLMPVGLMPDGTFNRADLRQAENEVLDMLYPSVVPTGDGSNWEERCEKRRLFLAHADRIAERLWSVTAGKTALGLEPVQLAPNDTVASLREALESCIQALTSVAASRPAYMDAVYGAQDPHGIHAALEYAHYALSSSPKEASTAQEPAQQTVSRLRQAIEYALEDASVEGRLWDGRAAYVAIGMTAYQGLVDALSSPKEAERP